jgi:O-antigen biosynthesis protein
MADHSNAATLTNRYAAHHGKVSDKWSLYLATYQRLFAPYQSAPVRLLEIGIQNGGSLAIWAQHFKSATAIIGCDINPACGELRYNDPRIHVVVGDANTDGTERLIVSHSESFDIILDNGSHRSGDIIRSFARYFSRLEEGGLFVVEDLHCSYWGEFEGGLLDPWSSMAFFKRLADVLNHEHWGVPYARADILRSFEARYGAHLSESLLSEIHSIEFVNSICVISKRPSAENVLGSRVVVGEEARAELLVAGSGSLSIAADQSANAWSALLPLPEDELLELREALAMATGRLQIERQFARNLAAEAEVQRAKATQFEHAAAVHQAAAEASCVHVDMMLRSTSWRVSAPVRWAGLQLERTKRTARLVSVLSQRVGSPAGLMRAGLHVLRHQGLSGVRSKLRVLENRITSPWPLHHNDFEAIARDIFAHQQSELSAELAQQMQSAFSHQPLISLIMPVYKTPVQWLRRAVASLQEQYYGRWELCVVDDCSPTDDQRNLLQELAASDARVRFKVMERNSGISAASNVALEMAQGEYVALLDHDDELTPDALFRVVEAINGQANLDFVYSDECKVDDTPARKLFDFIFKPDWSPELMFNGMLTGHLTVYRKALVEDMGGFRGQYDFSQDYDLALRVAEAARRIVHIERVLYLWRSIPGSAAAGGKDFARESNIAALDDALLRRGIPGVALPLAHANCVRIALPAESIRVSIIIPSDSVQDLRSVLRAIQEQTDYPNYEVVVVCNGPLAERLEDEFFDWPPLRFIKYNKKYNFSDKCNEGALGASGEIVIFYNDDVFPMQRDWIERLIEYLWVPGVGGVSPKLIHADDSIQYAGMISGTPGLCGTAYNNLPKDASDAFLSMHKYVRNVSILSGACCAFWKDVFWKVGAFDAVHTPDGHSDMDLSYKLIESGYRCVYTPYALLRHIGNHSWGSKRHKYKADIYALKRWGALVSRDPCFTDTMKRVLYHDFRFSYRIHAEHIDPQKTYPGPDILFVSHELSLTGAPRMLFYAARLVRQNGGFPVVVAPADGPLREEMVRAGIVVIIDESICHSHFLFERFARNFDVAVVNSIALTEVVRQLSAIPILRTLWWFHEAQSLSHFLRKVPGVQWERIRPLCVSEYAKSFVPQGIDVEVLYNGIPDEPVEPVIRDSAGPLTFILSGTIEPRKGQDIFVDAVALLPLPVRQQCRFVLTGKLWDMNRNFWSDIELKIANLPEIKYLGTLDHQSQLNLMAAADVVLCCSRDDPFPLVVMEAAMLSKPAILSDCVGLFEVLDGESCFVFESESAPSLAEHLLAAYECRSDLKRMGMAARRKFEQELTLEVFGRRFSALISEQIAGGAAPVQSDSGHTPSVGHVARA